MKDLIILEEDRNEGMSNYNDDYYDYLYWIDTVLSNKQYFMEFESAITGLKQLSELTLENYDLQQVLFRQIYIGTIGTIEVFLADSFINITMNKTRYLRRFIETNPELSKRKFEMKEIYDEYEKINATAQKIMYDTIYHDLSKVRNMFITTFSMKFPDITAVSKAVVKRHDLVHRNGKTKDGKETILTIDEVSATISIVEALAANIKQELKAAGVDFISPEDE